VKAASEADRIGELAGGKYRVVRLLAKGGMGVVYEAQHAVLRRRFAIKFLRRDLAERRDILTRFQREAEAAGALENENVAAAVDFGIAEDGTPYIVMEYLVGESLAALLAREGRLPVARAADIIVQACRGVAAAHAAEIVHRDLKPQNLFVSRRDDGTDLVKVLDFGVAKLQALDEASASTRTGTMLGTAAYMAPEQARGEKTVDARADIYALGAILYELLSEKRPHPGDSQNAILHHIATHPAVPLESVQPQLPAALLDVVGRALTSDPAARPLSAEALGRELAPLARREVWPAPREESGPRRVELTSTVLAGGGASPAGNTPSVRPGATGPTADDRAPGPATPGARARSRVVVRGALLVAALVVAAGVSRRVATPRTKTPATQARRTHAHFPPETRFLSAEAFPGAVAQIASLLKADQTRDAALLSAMVATPAGIWFLGGTPEQVRSDVADAVARSGRQGRVPVLVPYNHPFRDCTGYGLIGAADTAAYEAWIDGFASGIGNERAIVILEPNSIGLIPYAQRMDGRHDECEPTRAGSDGKRLPAPGATPDERFAQLAHAIDTLAAKAPNAAVYLDGTHSTWLPVGEVSYRLARAGVDKAAGFFLNAGNYQPTRRLIQYGTWVAKCLYHVHPSQAGHVPPGAYAQCASQSDWMDPNDDRAWDKVDAWYAEQVDHGAQPPAGPDDLTHFVINTNRNGRGPLDATVYGRAPYNQPPAVVQALRNGEWCMPPGRGLGIRPTTDTGVPLVDAYLWTDPPGLSVASCDIAGGARAWDYGRYNPWGIAGDTQSHFDPLWGRVLPPTGDWFPDEALELARNADPPLDADVLPAPAAAAALAGSPGAAGAPAAVPAAASGRPGGHKTPRGRPSGRPVSAAVGPAPNPATTASPAAATAREDRAGPARPTFDPDNPYR
jgi:endoglucanase